MKIRTKTSIIKHHPISHGGRFSRGNQQIDVLDFSSNTSPAGMPSSVKSAIKKRLDKMEHYPDTNSINLISSLKKYIGLSDSHIVVGNGAIEILYNFCNSFLSQKHVLIPTPTFSEYESASRLVDCKFTFFKTMNLSENIDSFISKIPMNGCVFVCNPNNPTGTILSKKQITKIILAAKNKSSFVFVDECFIELVPESDQSIINLVKKYDNLFVLRSLTKSFGLAGIRIGYGVGSKTIIEILKKIKIPWSVNALAQEAGITAIKNKSHLTKSKLLIKKESTFLKKKIAKITGFECHDSSTNFILIKTKQDSTKIQKKLLKHKILIRDCKNFRGLNNHYIRIAVKSHKDNLKLVSAMEAIA
ncbi:class I/II aminotransferase [Candidatus Nitrosopumilus koreensis AR1]|uniref:Aminotransferase n=1 Tax=Candidatus Nitrosopumilus koreensis AR1 TaxID=1229908 RepID=K0B7U6_9ARCH|nr:MULTISPECIES: histidinol-phosphate transaminase [Nitrosopumilus]AFS81579.1 class I/II aminotransferase [Candidatus Nitrosopumilus koreensis AR1]